ncbi:MAG TPA: PP2C family protein-serine/threonine phosphatase [Thermoanaerobaculia bacterium]|nr:PP2C family protein-serine/threonine phosphatase [Thermoanaerobaculia bacterium]
MWRRIPIVPMLFGACGALSMMTLASVHEPLLEGWRPYVAAAALGAAYVLAVYVILTWLPPPRSTFDNVGCGCFYAATGYFFLVVPTAVVAVSTAAKDYNIHSYAALASLVGFVGLGLLGGLMLARFRRAELERQKAALESQAATFAREQLELARDLQQRLLPPSTLESDRYRVTARNVAAAYVAGDFYDFVPLGENRLLLVLADVSGKGVKAGLIMATVKAIVPMLAAELTSPAPLLGRLNERLAGQLPQREFVAILLAIYDGERGSITIANAGLPDPLVIPSMKAIAVAGPRYPIGIRKKLNYESLTVTMAPGDRMILFTDGLPEAIVNGEPLGYERLSAEVKRSGGDIEMLFTALDKLGAGHEDDWTAIVFERRT